MTIPLQFASFYDDQVFVWPEVFVGATYASKKLWADLGLIAGQRVYTWPSRLYVSPSLHFRPYVSAPMCPRLYVSLSLHVRPYVPASMCPRLYVSPSICPRLCVSPGGFSLCLRLRMSPSIYPCLVVSPSLCVSVYMSPSLCVPISMLSLIHI